MRTKENTALRKKAMIEALEKSLGVVTQACKSVGMERKTHYKWMQNDEEYAKQVRELNNVALDFAESQLHKQINSGNTSATIFYLKCKGKDRGYVERVEVTGVEDGTPIQIEILDGSDMLG